MVGRAPVRGFGRGATVKAGEPDRHDRAWSDLGFTARADLARGIVRFHRREATSADETRSTHE